MDSVLFVNHIRKQCGIYEFGLNLFESIRLAKKYRFVYLESGNIATLNREIERHRPIAIIYNYHSTTMPWIVESRKDGIYSRIYGNDAIQFGIIHSIEQSVADEAEPARQHYDGNEELANKLFDFYIAPDPTLLLKNPLVFKIGRPLRNYSNTTAVPEIPVFSSATLATRGKGLEKMIAAVQNEYDVAEIRINIPAADFDEKNIGLEYVESCKSIVRKPGIQLKITHEYLDNKDLLDFLAGSTANVFLYEHVGARGISSALDNALVVRRPIVVSNSSMFRHITAANPGVVLENTSLKRIVERGFDGLERYLEEWCPEVVCWDVERIIGSAASRKAYKKRSFKTSIRKALGKKQGIQFHLDQSSWMRVDESMEGDDYRKIDDSLNYSPVTLPHDYSLCRVLDRFSKNLYAPSEAFIGRLVPNTMKRKIREANVNQAFVFDTVIRSSQANKRARILCIGAFEDTACMALIKMGYSVDEVDPLLNYDLETFVTKPTVRKNAYDIIFSTSVMEHVKDDENFLLIAYNLLVQGGIFIATVDFKDSWTIGESKPIVDERLYTAFDLEKRLPSSVPGFVPVGEKNYHNFECDFQLNEKNIYSFASMVLRKQK